MVEADVYFGALRRSWRLLVALAVVGAVVAVLLPVSGPKTKGIKYHWQSSAVVGAIPADGIGSTGVNTATILFYSNLIYAKYTAVKSIGLSGSLDQLAPLMSGVPVTSAGIYSTSTTTASGARAAKANGGISLVQLNAPGVTPALSAKLANAYSQSVQDEVNAAYAARQKAAAAASTSKSQASLPANSGFEVVGPAFSNLATHMAGPAPSPTASRKIRLPIGMLLGLLLGAAIVFIREVRDKTLRTKSKAEAAYGFPVIAELPPRADLVGSATTGAELEVWADPSSPSAEAYRMLRISINFEELADLTPPDPFAGAAASWQLTPKEAYTPPAPNSRRVVMVASAGDEQTRAVVAANLAATYSDAGQQVIVISTADIQVRRMEGEEPLLVSGPTDLLPYLQPSSLDHVVRLSLRPFVTSSGQLVNRAPAVLEAARELADLVIIEAGPLLTVHHGEALARAVDAVLVVAECGTTSEVDADRAGALIRRVGMPVLGVVLTNVGARGPQRPSPAVKPSTTDVPIEKVSASEAQISTGIESSD